MCKDVVCTLGELQHLWAKTFCCIFLKLFVRKERQWHRKWVADVTFSSINNNLRHLKLNFNSQVTTSHRVISEARASRSDAELLQISAPALPLSKKTIKLLHLPKLLPFLGPFFPRLPLDPVGNSWVRKGFQPRSNSHVPLCTEIGCPECFQWDPA